ncbi:hypothetical protein [Mesoterricola sediminis]|uniref:Uncharacterized protein n=1 Tax=Mesoterricola sediminis TaxID=2927980 RepID=A0AA48H0A5_9BACT|nr:hypothetical protein [Mesoterricola sediminis]BDU77655.1 hypothetical protein METESE_26130 [Mesoterricola sediminis]
MPHARLARSNRLPDSLPVVIRLLELHEQGITIAEMQREIERMQLWDLEAHPAPRALYHRIYSVLAFLKEKGLVHQRDAAGRETLWVLDGAAFAKQRRKELFEVLQPFVDGCLMISDPRQLVGQLQGLVEDGTIDEMLAERRARKRQLP